MSSSSLYSGEGETRLASGVDMICSMRRQSDRTGAAVVQAGSRQWCCGDTPGATAQPMSRRAPAGGVPAACLGVRSRVRWLLERVLPWHFDRCRGAREGGARWARHSIRRAGMGARGSGTEPGAMQLGSVPGTHADTQKHGGARSVGATARRPCCCVVQVKVRGLGSHRGARSSEAGATGGELAGPAQAERLWKAQRVEVGGAFWAQWPRRVAAVVAVAVVP
jgi:hypothetical protein